jgi:hypothetical protein
MAAAVGMRSNRVDRLRTALLMVRGLRCASLLLLMIPASREAAWGSCLVSRVGAGATYRQNTSAKWRFLNWCPATCQLPAASCNRCLLP